MSTTEEKEQAVAEEQEQAGDDQATQEAPAEAPAVVPAAAPSGRDPGLDSRERVASPSPIARGHRAGAAGADPPTIRGWICSSGRRNSTSSKII